VRACEEIPACCARPRITPRGVAAPRHRPRYACVAAPCEGRADGALATAAIPSQALTASGARRAAAPLLATLLLAGAAGWTCSGGGGAAAGAGPFPDGRVHRGPVVLITLGSLRADMVGALAGDTAGRGDLTPHLDALAAEADWVGRAVAPSSWSLPSLATLATGLPPWLHQTITVGTTRLDPELRTLGEAFEEQGYLANAYISGAWFRSSNGWGQGMEHVRALRAGAFAAGHLESLGEAGAGPQLVWVHVPEPEAPYRRFDPLRGQLPPLPAAFLDALPESLGPAELERWADPARPLSAAQLRVLDTLYRFNVARGDARLGRMLDALRASGAWDDTLLVVTAPNGEELGEYGSTGSGNSLGRALLEVPLVIKLPRGLRGDGGEAVIAEPPGRRVALSRVWATLVAAVGGEVPPAAGPGLFTAAAGGGILSELYMMNGYNELSLVEEDDAAAGGAWQLLWRSPFADPEPGYRPARLATYLGAPPAGLAESPEAVLGRIERGFLAAPPLSGRGGGERRTTLLRWRPGGGVEAVDDPARAAAMAERLRRRWLAFQECERSPGEEAAHRSAARAAADRGRPLPAARRPAAGGAGSR
jgi:hypothetical protein